MDRPAPSPPKRPRRIVGHILVLAVALLLLATPLAAAADGGGPKSEVIEGRVYDERGVPKADVRVVCEARGASTLTDSSGDFELRGTGLEGEGTLILLADGYMTARISYELEDGGSLRLSVYMVEEQTDAEGTATVTVRVRNLAGGPLDGALVTLSADGLEARVARTDGTGEVTFADVPAGNDDHTVTVEADGYGTAAEALNVTPGEDVSVEVTLSPDRPVELLIARVTDQLGRALPGAMVQIEGSRATWSTDLEGRFTALLEGRLGERNVTVSMEGYETLRTSVLFGPDGVAELETSLPLDGSGDTERVYVRVLNARTGLGVPGATVRVEGHEGSWTTDLSGLTLVVAADLEGSRTLAATAEEHTTTSVTMELMDGGTLATVLEITRTSNAVTLSGVVIDSRTEAPVANAYVSVDAGGILRMTLTDPEGRFNLQNLPPGVPTLLSAFGDDHLRYETTVVLEEYVVEEVLIELSPLPTGTVELTMLTTDVDDGSPVSDARVTLVTESSVLVARSGADGLVSFPDLPLRAGAARYMVEHWSYRMASGLVDLAAAGDRIVVEVPLVPVNKTGTMVRGLVTDPDGFAIDGALVTVSTSTGSWTTRTIDGAYELYPVLASDTEASVSASGECYGSTLVTTSIGARETNVVDLTLPLGPSVANVVGRVLDQSERPLEGAEVHLTLPGEFHEDVVTGADGAFAFRCVAAAAEAYQLSAVVEGYDGVTVDASLQGGRTLTQDLVVHEEVESIETLRGTVTDAEGQPIGGASVSIDGHEAVPTGPDGTFAVASPDLDGPREMEVSSPGFRTAVVTIDLGPGEEVHVEVALSVVGSGSATVAGRVVSAGGAGPLEGAIVRLGWYATDSFTFETATDAEGVYSFTGVPIAWGTVVVMAQAEGYVNDTASSPLSTTEGTWLTFSLRKVEQPSDDGGGMTTEQKRAVGVGVGAVVTSIAAFAATEVGKVALLSLLLVPLYTKIKRERVMDHFIRGRIYEYICNNPGVNYSAIKDRFNLTNGTVTYHLSMLERQEFVRAKQDGIYKRYFKNGGGISASDVEPMSVQLIIAKVVRESPGLTQKEIAKRVGSSKQLVSYHIRKMKHTGALETRREGRSVRVYPNHNTPQ